VPPSGTGGGGGGGGGAGVECFRDVDCEDERYCFENKCYDAQCFEDSECNVNQSEVCWNFRCAKLFDIKILEFESPAKLGEFFDFTYFLKGVAEINGDVEINFWIEHDGNVVTSGSDVIFLGSFEEKTEKTKLFLPSDVRSGTYEFIIQVNLGTYTVRAQRTIEITVTGGIATLQLFDITFSLDDSLIQSSDELSAIVTFENFGTGPTLIDLTFIILDEVGNEVYREEDRITVIIEEVLRKSFTGLNLPRGKYTLVLHTLYDVDVFDEFRQEFEIRKREILGIPILIWQVIGVIIVGIVGFILIRMLMIKKLILSMRKVKRMQEREAKVGGRDRVKAEKERIRGLRKTERKKIREKRPKEKARIREEKRITEEKARKKAKKVRELKILKMKKLKEQKLKAKEKLREKAGVKAEKERIRKAKRSILQQLRQERLREKAERKAEKVRIREQELREERARREAEQGKRNKRLREMAKKKAERDGIERKKLKELARGKSEKERLKEEVRKKKEKELLEQKKGRISEIGREIKKLESKKGLLERGYKAGYIDEKSYQMDMKKLEKLISRLRKKFGGKSL